MRLMLIVVTVAVAMLLDLRASQATQMPWCAGTNTGDFFHYNCTLPTSEMCVQEVIAGNRGFCSPNPNYGGPEFVPPGAKRQRYHYSPTPPQRLELKQVEGRRGSRTAPLRCRPHGPSAQDECLWCDH